MQAISPLVSYLVWIMIGYLSGSIPVGYWIGKLKGIDLTQVGSRSTGATNVLRKVGKFPALVTLIIDILKGLIPVYFCYRYTKNEYLVLCVAMMCVLGHSKSIFLKFKGGKSSATGLGILIAINWQSAIIAFLIWLMVVFTTRYSSLGSIVTVPLVPIFLYIFTKSVVYVLFGIVIAFYIVAIRHKENIKRLLEGTEPKIGI